MSWINLGEVHCVLRRLHGEDAAAETVRDLRDVIDARLPDESLVVDAARIKADHPMTYADAFAAALTVASDATLWTGEPELFIDGVSWRWRDLRSQPQDEPASDAVPPSSSSSAKRVRRRVQSPPSE